ncbi:MAG: hypothetical protein KIT80_24050, partial [Chitinophagaceae bacterium]|nr:hypothetical protein [Chitinophagaceae bacterium]
MADPIGMYFQHSQLAMAAYADFTATMSSNDYKRALKDAGFTDPLVDTFVAAYSVIGETFTDPVTGLSVTLFQKVATGEKILAIRGTNPDEVGDLITDGLLLAGESATLSPQYVALQRYYSQLIEHEALGRNELLSVTGHSLGGFLAQAFTVDHATNIRHTYTYNAPGIGGVVIEVLERLGVAANTVPSGAITNIIGENGLSIAAGLGTQIGKPVNIFIEGTGFNTSFHDHQIATATDALAWYDLAARIDPTIDVAAVTRFLEASSSVAARRLEASLDTLRVLFTGDRTPTPSGPSGMGDPNREAYYVNLINLRNSLPSTNDYRLVDLVGMSSATVFSQAKSPTLDGLAYRYALRELNPFVMIGIDYEALHNQDHSLDIYDADTGVGVWTQMALSDRAELLAEKLRFNVNDGTPSSSTLFVDETTNFNNQRGATAIEAVMFGDIEGREYLGRRGNDHIYGGAGNDFVHGAGGQDYLEGNEGNDELYGEADNDILLGQQGSDTLNGGAGADRMSGGLGDDIYIVDNLGDKVFEVESGGLDQILASVDFSLSPHVENLTLTGMENTSGTGNNLDNRITGNNANNRLTGMGGNDLLEGGIGVDTYVYSSGDGMDRIEDSDAQGRIIFDGRVLQGGVRRAGDAANTYT